MAEQWQIRRGTAAENDEFTGAIGEITMDTTNNTLRIHDGSTQGGHLVGGTSTGDSLNNQNLSSDIPDIRMWLGTDSQYGAQEVETEHPDYLSIIIDDESGDDEDYDLVQYPARNVGDIFFTKRLDVELNGAVECNGGTYYISDYEGLDSIGELFRSNRLQYISMSDYATLIAAKGWCDKFAWDGGNNDIFKVPTLTAKVIQENNIPVIGDGKTLGLTNGTENYGIGGISVAGVTATQSAPSFYNTTPGTTSGGGAHSTGALGLTQTTGESGIIIDLSDSSVDLRVMVQLANGYLDDAVETCRTVKEHSVIEFQMPTSTNSYTWYRKYSDGWCEQGGICATTTSLIYPVTMADTNYTIFLQPRETVGKYAMNARALTTTGATIDTDAPEWHNYSWRIEGMYTTGE